MKCPTPFSTAEALAKVVRCGTLCYKIIIFIKIYPMKKLSFFFLICFILLLFSGSSYAQVWDTIGNANFSAGITLYTSMAIDNGGTPYVAYQDGSVHLKATVMKYNGSNWVNVGSPGFSDSTAEYLSFAMDRNNVPYVAFGDDIYGNVTVMKYDGSNWIDVGSPGFGTAIMTGGNWLTIDSGGTPYVAYSTGVVPKATVMKYDGSNWVYVGTPGFSAGEAQYITIAVDRNGTPYVSYRDYANGDAITVMKYDGSNWVNVGSPGFSPTGVALSSLAIDSAGTPYVAFKDNGDSNKATVMKYDGSNWTYVGSRGFTYLGVTDVVLTIDKNGTLYVALSDDIMTVMKYDGVNWVTVGYPHFSSVAVYFPFMAIDTGGTLYVSFTDANASDGNKATVMRYGFPASVKNISAKAPSLTLFPNPTHNAFTLHLTTPQKEDADIIITNFLGEKVKQLTAYTNEDREIQLNAAPGVYFVTAVTKEGNVSGKIAIQ